MTSTFRHSLCLGDHILKFLSGNCQCFMPDNFLNLNFMTKCL